MDHYGVATNNTGEGYLTNKKVAPETNRQFTAQNEYTGVAGSKDKKTMSYEDIYAMTLNEVREATLKGRAPTDSNVSMAVGGDMINIDIAKLDEDRENARDLVISKITNAIPSMDTTVNNCNFTSDKDTLCSNNLERIDPTLLEAYRENPYTHALNTSV